MARAVGIAAILGAVLGVALTGELARALPGAGSPATAVRYVLDPSRPARVAEVRLELGTPGVKDARVKLDRGTWIRCRVAGSAARCAVPAGQGSVERLGRIAVVVER